MYYSFMVGIGIRLFIPLMLTRNFTNKRVFKNGIYTRIFVLKHVIVRVCHLSALTRVTVQLKSHVDDGGFAARSRYVTFLYYSSEIEFY